MQRLEKATSYQMIEMEQEENSDRKMWGDNFENFFEFMKEFESK